MKTVIEMAREAAGDDWGLFQEFMPEIHRLAEFVRAEAIAEEREACAKVCDELHPGLATKRAAEIIRARSEK